MQYSFMTPPSSRAAERPMQIEDSLVADARRALALAMRGRPPAIPANRQTSQAFFAAPMAELCSVTRMRGVPIEKLIIAVKLAWPDLVELRVHFGDGASEALSGAVSACIAAYYLGEDGRRAD